MNDSHNTANRVAELFLRQNPPRDPLTGRLLSDLTQRQLDAVLERYPCLRAVAPTLPDPHAVPAWTSSSYFNGLRVIAPEDARRELARSSALLKDPVVTVQRREPTKPAPATNKPSPHSDERRWHIVQHEAAHAVIALMLDREVSEASALPAESGSDGHVMFTASSDARTLNACVSLAGQVWDELVGQYKPEYYLTDNKHVAKDIGDNKELRDALKAKVREYLVEAFPAVIEVARQLFLEGKLSAFDTKLAYIKGMRNARAAATKAGHAPARSKGRVYSSANPADAAEMERRFGKVIIGSSGCIIAGSAR